MTLYQFDYIFNVVRIREISVHSLLCLSDGEGAGEGIEVRGAGTGHWRIGSSVTCPLFFSAIINSIRRNNDKDYTIFSKSLNQQQVVELIELVQILCEANVSLCKY